MNEILNQIKESAYTIMSTTTTYKFDKDVNNEILQEYLRYYDNFFKENNIKYTVKLDMDKNILHINIIEERCIINIVIDEHLHDKMNKIFLNNNFKGDNIMKRAVVLAGFPGVGKSTIFKKGYNDKVILDSDSSNFSWVWNLNHTRKSNVRDLNFPQNYIDHIKDNLDKADIIFVSTHTEVLDALVKADIDFSIVYPSKDRKKEFMDLYKKRGNDEGFLKTLDSNFENWVEGIIKYPIPDYKKIELKSGEFIADIL